MNKIKKQKKEDEALLWQKEIRIRVILISIVVLIIYSLLIVRLVQLQIIDREGLFRIARKQHQGIYKLSPKRGTIYDRNMEDLALSIEVESVYVHPYKIEDRIKTAGEVARILGLKKAEVLDTLREKSLFVWIKRKVLKEKLKELKELNIDGIGFLKESRRFYPNMDLAGHVLGFVGMDSIGLEGLELKYDDYLRGEAGYILMERDAVGRGIISDELELKKSVEGASIVLTLDKNIQHIVQRELKRGLNGSEGESGIAIVMEPTTGKVLAMATEPSFNPNAFSKYRPAQWRNRAITDVYEPGSTFKVLLLSASLEDKVVGVDDIFFCENGSMTIADKVIGDHKEFGWLSIPNIIKYSSNIGAAKLGGSLGKKRFYHYIRAFGMDQRTRIDLPGEARGILNHPQNWSEVCLANISFGQGISTTAIQMLSAINVIASGGYLLKTYIVEKIIDQNGRMVMDFSPRRIRKVISRETSKVVTQILRLVVEEEGTGVQARVKGFYAAGKTGTAQKVDLINGGYSGDKFTASFMGFLPAEDPIISIFVLIDEPKTSIYGGIVAAPIFKRIAEDVLKYLNVFPPRDGDGEITLLTQALPPPPPVSQESIMKGDGKALMPDLKKLGIREVLKISEGKFTVEIDGSGFATSQSIPPGSVVGMDTICLVKFSGM